MRLDSITCWNFKRMGDIVSTQEDCGPHQIEEPLPWLIGNVERMMTPVRESSSSNLGFSVAFSQIGSVQC